MPPSLSKPKPKTKTPVPGFCSTHAKKGSMQTCSRMPTRQSRLSPSSARAPHIHKLNKFALSLECDCRLVCSTWSEGCTILRFRNPPPRPSACSTGNNHCDYRHIPQTDNKKASRSLPQNPHTLCSKLQRSPGLSKAKISAYRTPAFISHTAVVHIPGLFPHQLHTKENAHKKG